MKPLSYRIRFSTPAFLGDAEQNGRWRTPPFKAQLRQWWRMVWAADHGYSVNLAHMRREEGLMFGNAWLSHFVGNREVKDHCKSLVRLRLDRWDEGQLKKQQWPADLAVTHPEVPRPIGSALYLGFGPLEFQGGTKLKKNAAIQAGESAGFSLAFPTTHNNTGLKAIVEANASRIERALWLMHRYGTVGGRSRNGWGSYELKEVNGTPRLAGKVPFRPWRDCLGLDWPHAIGQDEKGALIWQTAPHDDWKTLMKTLAVIKIGLRTQFRFTTGRGAPSPEVRHWLSYPVTNHDVRSWNVLRLPNQLRFKVRGSDDGKLVGVIFHVPHLPPPAFAPSEADIVNVWQCVHEFLDALTKQPRERRYCGVADTTALAKQRAQLDQVLLKRVSE